MTVGLVIPAHGRYQVSRLAFTGVEWLISVLAGRGITAQAVVIADDGNLDLAAEHKFDTLKVRNVLGRKVNAGFEYAAESGADWLCFVGSDDWLHPNLFEDGPLTGDAIVTGERVTIVDLVQPRLTTLRGGSREGMPPWLIPRALLEKCGFRPVEDDRTRGIEGALARTLHGCQWAYHDPHDLARVDFKSAVGMSSYDQLRGYGRDESLTPWARLAEHYPADLVDLAVETSEALRLVAA